VRARRPRTQFSTMYNDVNNYLMYARTNYIYIVKIIKPSVGIGRYRQVIRHYQEV